jgi:hypothetical protein
MSAFDALWLDLRATADTAARSRELLERLAAVVVARRISRCIDLATGTGANLRSLADRLGPQQDWLAVDHDAALLAAFTERTGQWARSRGGTARVAGGRLVVTVAERRLGIETACIDLASDLASIAFDERTLVTASAFLDLVGSEWLDRFVAHCRASRAVVYVALTYDGVAECQPSHPDDPWVVAALNRHQRRNKGFGPALGPDAPSVAEEAFAQAGFEVFSERSDWQLGAAESSLQAALFDGWAAAARELEPDEAGRIDAWLEARRASLKGGLSRVRVGHRDLLAT